jgi:parvulin-like peptidyl-prolyl isomerase
MVQACLEKLQARNLLKKLGVVILLCVSFSFAQLLDRVVANVNGEPILESELKVAEIFYGEKDRDKLLQQLIEKHLIAQFLRERGLNIPESYIESVLLDIAKSNNRSLEELYEELYRNGLSPKDLKEFLKIEIAATQGLREFLLSKIEVSDVEIELERLRKGDISYVREIELLAVSKEKKDTLLNLVKTYGTELESIAKELGEDIEKIRVKRGELVEPLDREVWRARRGEIVVAEDENYIYLAKVVRETRIISGRSEEEIREELLRRKMETEKRRLVEKLKKRSFVSILG